MKLSRLFQKFTSTEAVNSYIKEHESELVRIDDEKLHELQKCYLSILKDIDDFFERNELKYCLSGGSVLGKIRHNGFIPWDDDIDLTIPREDYEKLKHIFELSVDPFCKKYDFKGPGYIGGTTVRIAKIYKNDSVMESVISKTDTINKVFIDLFVIDYVPDNNIMMYLRGSLSLLLIVIIACVETKVHKSNIEFDLGFAWKVQRAIRLLIGAFLSLVPLKTWYNWLDKITMNTSVNKRSKRITFPTGRIFYFAEMMPTDDYYPFKRTDFCGVPTWLPNQPEKYLENRYGDWKKIPDVKDRESHYVKKLELGKY